MQKFILLFISMLTASGSYGQVLFPDGIFVNTPHHKYNIRAYQSHNFSSISIINMTEIGYWAVTPNVNPPIDSKDVHFYMPKIHQIVMQVLETKKAELSVRKEILSIYSEFAPDGQLVLIRWFSIKAPTILTIEDINKIHVKLKDQFLVQFTGNEYKQYQRIIRPIRIRFEEL